MLYLVDTGVLLRLFNRADPFHPAIRQCLREQTIAGHRLAISPQNVAEFWNVSTRPHTARGGYGLSVEQTELRVRMLERMCEILPENRDVYSIWRSLVLRYQVKGVQVHDARLVAVMQAQAITHIITLNVGDFQRYHGIIAQSPETLVNSPPAAGAP